MYVKDKTTSFPTSEVIHRNFFSFLLQATIEQEEFVHGFDQVLNDVRIKNEANANSNNNNNNNSNTISTNNSTTVTITSTNTMSGGGIVTYAGKHQFFG